MIEKHIVLEHIDLVTFYGVNNMHLQMIKALYPKLRIVARGNIIKVMGDEEEMCSFEENINKMQQHCLQYNSLNEEDILLIVKGGTPACMRMSLSERSSSVNRRRVIFSSIVRLLLVCPLGRHDLVEFQVGREPVHERQDDIAKEQKPLALAGVRHIRKLVRRDVKLLCEYLPVALRFADSGELRKGTFSKCNNPL